MFLFNGSAGLGDKNQRRADDSLEASVTGSLDSESSTGELHFYLPVADCTTIEVESALKSGISASISLVKGYLLAPSLLVCSRLSSVETALLSLSPSKSLEFPWRPQLLYTSKSSIRLLISALLDGRLSKVFECSMATLDPSDRLRLGRFIFRLISFAGPKSFFQWWIVTRPSTVTDKKKTGTACEIATTRGGCQQTSIFWLGPCPKEMEADGMAENMATFLFANGRGVSAAEQNVKTRRESRLMSNPVMFFPSVYRGTPPSDWIQEVYFLFFFLKHPRKFWKEPRKTKNKEIMSRILFRMMEKDRAQSGWSPDNVHIFVAVVVTQISNACLILVGRVRTHAMSENRETTAKGTESSCSEKRQRRACQLDSHDSRGDGYRIIF